MDGRSRRRADPDPVARLSYVQARCEWTLLWRDRNLHWHIYDELAPGPSVDPLLEEIGSSRNPVFWGDRVHAPHSG